MFSNSGKGYCCFNGHWYAAKEEGGCQNLQRYMDCQAGKIDENEFCPEDEYEPPYRLRCCHNSKVPFNSPLGGIEFRSTGH